MDIDQADALRPGAMLFYDFAESAVGPGRPQAAEKHSLGKRVLAACDHGLEGQHAVIVAPSLQRGVCFGAPGAIPVGRHQQIMDFRVAQVLRQRLGEILEIAVEIHIVLGHAADVGEAVRINGMHQQHSHRLGPVIDDALLDQTNLATGAAKALVTVRARAGNEKGIRIDVAETGDIDGKVFAIRARGIGIDVAFDGGAAGTGGVEKLPAGLRICRRKILRNSHRASRKISACGGSFADDLKEINALCHRSPTRYEQQGRYRLFKPSRK